MGRHSALLLSFETVTTLAVLVVGKSVTSSSLGLNQISVTPSKSFQRVHSCGKSVDYTRKKSDVSEYRNMWHSVCIGSTHMSDPQVGVHPAHFES